MGQEGRQEFWRRDGAGDLGKCGEAGLGGGEELS